MTDGSEPVPASHPRREIDLGRWITSGWKLIRGELLGYMLAALIWAVASDSTKRGINGAPLVIEDLDGDETGEADETEETEDEDETEGEE